MLNGWTNAFQLALSFTDRRAQSVSITVFPVALKITISLFIPQAPFSTAMCLQNDTAISLLPLSETRELKNTLQDSRLEPASLPVPHHPLCLHSPYPHSLPFFQLPSLSKQNLLLCSTQLSKVNGDNSI